MLRPFLLCVAFLASSAVLLQTSQAQTNSYTAEGYYVEQFTTADGLPSNRVRAIHEDQFGFMWFGTNQGLVRYDGYEFKTYFPDGNDSLAIKPHAIAAIAEDKQGNLWVGGDRFVPQGVSFYNRDLDGFTKHYVEESDSLSGMIDGVQSIMVSESEDVWIGAGFLKGNTASAGSLRRIGKNGLEILLKDSTFEISSENFITGIVESEYGEIWISGYGVTKYDAKNETFETYLPYPENTPDVFYVDPNHFMDMFEPPSNPDILLLGSHAGGVLIFDKKTKSFSSVDISRQIQQGSGVFSNGFFAEAEPGEIWLRIRNALHIYDMETGEVRRTNITGTSHIERIFKDSNGSMWVGTWSHGVFKVSPSQLAFSPFSPRLESGIEIPGNEINILSSSKDGTLWLSHSGDFLLQGQ